MTPNPEEHPMSSNENPIGSTASTILAFLAGAAAGAALAALTLPRSGPELRDELAHLGSRARRKTGHMADRALEAGEDARDELTR